MHLAAVDRQEPEAPLPDAVVLLPAEFLLHEALQLALGVDRALRRGDALQGLEDDLVAGDVVARLLPTHARGMGGGRKAFRGCHRRHVRRKGICPARN